MLGIVRPDVRFTVTKQRMRNDSDAKKKIFEETITERDRLGESADHDRRKQEWATGKP